MTEKNSAEAAKTEKGAEAAVGSEPPKKPLIKPKKIFKPKKVTFKSDTSQQYRTRHIRLSSLESATLIQQTLLDFQKELAERPMDDPDKEFIDQEKLEKFFARLAKKYSTCPTRALGGDLQWIHKKMEDIDTTIMTSELIDVVINGERFKIPPPVKTPLGYHIVLICESKALPKKKMKKVERTIVDDIHGNASEEKAKVWKDAPN